MLSLKSLILAESIFSLDSKMLSAPRLKGLTQFNVQGNCKFKKIREKLWLNMFLIDDHLLTFKANVTSL